MGPLILACLVFNFVFIPITASNERCQCGPGYHVIKSCTKFSKAHCAPCPSNTFSGLWDESIYCQECPKRCTVDGQELVHPCFVDKLNEDICQCKQGSHLPDPSSNYCVKNKPCSPRHRLSNPGDVKNPPGCVPCPNGTGLDRPSFITDCDVATTPSRADIHYIPPEESGSGVTEQPTGIAEDNTTNKVIFGVLGTLLSIAVIVIVFLLCCYFYLKRKKNKEQHELLPEEERMISTTNNSNPLPVCQNSGDAERITQTNNITSNSVCININGDNVLPNGTASGPLLNGAIPVHRTNSNIDDIPSRNSSEQPPPFQRQLFSDGRPSAEAEPPIEDNPLNQQIHKDYIDSLLKEGLAYTESMAEGEFIQIAIIDSGIKSNHPLFREALQNNYIVHMKNVIDDNNNVEDYDGHGSYMFGIFLRYFAPCLKHMRFVIIKAVDDNGELTKDNFLKALEYLKTKPNVKVVSLSAGFLKDPVKIEHEVAPAVAELQKTKVFVCAVGNSGSYEAEGIAVPAKLGIACGSHDCHGNRAPNSPQGPELSFLAPGVNLVVPDIHYQDDNPNTWTTRISGSSTAAAITAGVAAMVIIQLDKRFADGRVTLTVQLKTLVQSTTGMREVLKQATKYKHHKDNEVGCGPLIPNYIFAEQNEQTFIHAIKEACNPTPARS